MCGIEDVMDELGTGAAVRCWARKWGLIRSDPPLCPHRDAIQEDGEGTWGPVCGKAMAEVKDVSFKNDGVVWHDRNPSFPPTSTSSSGGRETEAPTRTRWSSLAFQRNRRFSSQRTQTCEIRNADFRLLRYRFSTSRDGTEIL